MGSFEPLHWLGAEADYHFLQHLLACVVQLEHKYTEQGNTGQPKFVKVGRVPIKCPILSIYVFLSRKQLNYVDHLDDYYNWRKVTLVCFHS